MRRALVTTALLALLVPALPGATGSSGAVDAAGDATGPGRDAPTSRSAAAVPALSVSTRIAGLNHPWDVKQLPSGSLLVTERDPARLTLSTPGGDERDIAFPSNRIWTSGETGLMGLAVDPDFAANRRFYTCSGWEKEGPGHDIRVNAWTLDRSERRATLKRALLTGLPTTSGRHGGCRLLMAQDGSLVVGTGDAAVGRNPRNLRSLGGKTLRLNRFSGKPWPSNPFVQSKIRSKRYLLTYGHRNVQGLAQRADGTLWSVEHGSFRDDEVNRLVRGGDYGWNPVPGYNERVPMTDQGLPGRQIGARWRSGTPTVATSGATFVYGSQWGDLDGALFVATLAGERMLAMTFGPRGRLERVSTPAALARDYGRLRTVTQLRNGDLLVCTDADGGQGRVLLVSPR